MNKLPSLEYAIENFKTAYEYLLQKENRNELIKEDMIYVEIHANNKESRKVLASLKVDEDLISQYLSTKDPQTEQNVSAGNR